MPAMAGRPGFFFCPPGSGQLQAGRLDNELELPQARDELRIGRRRAQIDL